MLRVENLKVCNGPFCLKNIKLSLKGGEYLVILGPSGSGKTTLLETLAGFKIPKEGKITLKGKDITFLPPEERNISLLFQDYLLFPHLSVYENIAFGLKRKEKNKKKVEQKVRSLASLLGIESLLNKKPQSLSGGQKQRVALARALAYEPKVLLLDEPFSALDPENREKLRPFVKRWAKERKVPVLHVSHDFTDAKKLADRVALIHNGEILQVAPFEEILKKPKNKRVKEFLSHFRLESLLP